MEVVYLSQWAQGPSPVFYIRKEINDTLVQPKDALQICERSFCKWCQRKRLDEGAGYKRESDINESGSGKENYTVTVSVSFTMIMRMACHAYE